MTLARLTEVLAPAAASGTGLGAFNVFSIEHAEALTAAAEAAGTPVVLQISQNAVRYHGALAPIGLATLALAREGTVPMVVHLDHATDASLVDEAVGPRLWLCHVRCIDDAVRGERRHHSRDGPALPRSWA